MAWLDSIFAATRNRNPADDYWFSPLSAGPTLAGTRVNADSALSLMSVYSAVRLLATTIAQTPLITYRLQSGRGRFRARQTPTYQLLHGMANEQQSSFEFLEMQQAHLSLRGNAYAEIFRDPQSGLPTALVPLHPDKVDVVRVSTGPQIGYIVTEQSGKKRPLTSHDVLHLKGLSANGMTGLAPLDIMAQSVGTALAAEGYAASFFQHGATPGGFLKHPKNLSEAAHTRLKEWFVSNHAGWANNGRPAILEEGLEWTAVGVTPEHSQLLATRQFHVTEIARAFHVPPHLIGDLSKATFSNIEQQSLEFVQFYMAPHFRRWESRVQADLVNDASLSVEFLLDNLLRGDTITRYNAYRIAIESGFMTRNEVRKRENLNTRPELDKFIMPLNMSTAAQFNVMKHAACQRIVRKEVSALETAHKRAAGDIQKLRDQISAFYDPFASFIADVLGVPDSQGEQYAMWQKHRALAAINNDFIEYCHSLTDEWLVHYTQHQSGDQTYDSHDTVSNDADESLREHLEHSGTRATAPME